MQKRKEPRKKTVGPAIKRYSIQGMTIKEAIKKMFDPGEMSEDAKVPLDFLRKNKKES